jgi:hypothetical protein
MRLSELLSRAPGASPAQIEGFLDNRTISWGKHRKIKVGKVFHNFHCKRCNAQRTFQTGDELYCLGLDYNAVSVDATLKCIECGAAVEAWFLLASDDDISGHAPIVRIDRYSENLRDRADRVDVPAGQFADLIKRALVAHETQLGAGSMIYLRKILESITFEVAEIVGVETSRANGKRRPFKDVLQDVNQKRQIMPQRYSSNGYQLFSELSEAIHGGSSEEDGLQKFRPCMQLVLGVVDEVNRDNVFSKAIDELGWNVDNINELANEGGTS